MDIISSKFQILLKVILLLSVTVYSYSNQAQSSSMSTKELLKFTKKLYKEQRSATKERVKLTKTNDFDDTNLCVGCANVKSLVFAVNKTLFHLSNSIEKDDPKQKVLEHVEGLEAMYHYTMTTNELGEKNCHKSVDGFQNSILKHSFGNFNEDESEVIFSDMIPLSSLEALHLRNGDRKTYYYRAKEPHRDVVIKVDITGDERARVSYYKMEMTDELVLGMKNEREIEEINLQAKLKREEKSKWGGWFENKSEDSSDYFNYGAGFEVEYDDYLPRRLTLVKGESLTPLTEDVSFKTMTEISSKRVSSNFSLTDKSGDEYVEVEVKTSRAELRIPSRIDIFSTGYQLKSSVSANTNDEQGIDFEILGDPRNRNKFEIMSTDRGMAYSIENMHQIDKRQSISIKFTNDEQQGSSGFLRYELKL